MPPLSRPASLALAALVAAAAACGDDGPTPPGGGVTPADTGRFTGTAVTGTTTTATFTAARNGSTNVAVCGRAGTNFDLAVGTMQANSASNCERVTFDAVAGRSYTITVAAVAGGGAFNGCWANLRFLCQVLEPAGTDDPGIPAGYYAAAEGRTGAALLQALHDIVRAGHHGFQYDTARGWLYQDIEDPDDDDRIEDVYAGRVATVDRRASSATDAGDANFNAEHSWPQSCGARLDRLDPGDDDRSRGPRGDLHTIFASDANANNSRSNFPFGMVSGTASASFGPDSAGNFSRRGSNGTATVFEPRAEKRGDLARALFYFYVRYVPEIPDQLSLANFNVEESTLRQWAQQDPPDDFERARNNEVYARQGNRNPFVDVPEFLGRISDFPNTATGAHATCDF